MSCLGQSPQVSHIVSNVDSHEVSKFTTIHCLELPLIKGGGRFCLHLFILIDNQDHSRRMHYILKIILILRV